MSAQPNHSGRNIHPNSLANLRPTKFKSGDEWNGNPGGQLGGNRVDVEYQKILNLTADQIRDYEPVNGAQILAWKQYKEACTNPNSLGYAQEITNRTSGKVADKLEVSTKYSEETRQMIVVEAYVKVFASKSLEESISAIRAIYDAPDEPSRRLAIQAAIQADSEAVAAVWVDAEKAVTGDNGVR